MVNVGDVCSRLQVAGCKLQVARDARARILSGWGSRSRSRSRSRVLKW